jgi:hypothetical protein
VNLRSNAHVILMTGCNQWDSGLDIVVEGEAVEVTDEELLERLADEWGTKWDGRWHYEAREGASVMRAVARRLYSQSSPSRYSRSARARSVRQGIGSELPPGGGGAPRSFGWCEPLSQSGFFPPRIWVTFRTCFREAVGSRCPPTCSSSPPPPFRKRSGPTPRNSEAVDWFLVQRLPCRLERPFDRASGGTQYTT